MKNVLVLVLAVVSFNAQAKQSKPDIAKCAERIQKECRISNNDEKRIIENAVTCKQVNSFGEKMEAVVLESGDVTIVQVENNCRVVKYDLGGRTDIEDMKVIGNYAYMATDTGAAYMLRADRNGAPLFFEILKANKQSYGGQSAVDKFKGTSGGQGVLFLDKNENPLTIVDGQVEVNGEEVERLEDKGRLRKIHFQYGPADRSLFRN